MSIADAVLEIIPEAVLKFILSSKEPTPTCILELRHPDPKAAPVAFKVKTTQPRRYLVRPNQGLILPGESRKVQIVLVEKDKTTLLQSFHRLGQSALDHSKDKFLVQSVAILDSTLATELKEYDRLTSLWASVGSGATLGSTPGSTSAVANKKLHVIHTASADEESAAVGVASPAAGDTTKRALVTPTSTTTTSRDPVESLSTEQLRTELGSLRGKYDELVVFSVNLTAERDMLNNTLEQTKRDLNRQVAKTAAQDNARGGSRTGAAGSNVSGGVSTWNLLLMVVVAVAMLAAGIKLEQLGLVPPSIPILGTARRTPIKQAGKAMFDEL